MEAKSQKVSAFEAKTKLSELLRETDIGEGKRSLDWSPL
jgi:hypothetical protein